MNGIKQLGGYLKILLMGRSSGIQVPVAVDADGHPQLDILTMPNLTVAFSTGTTTPSEINPDDTGAAGASSLASKEDHAHGFPCGTPGTTTLGDASAEGSGADATRSDHKHKYIITGLADGRFERKDATTGRIVGLPGTSKRVEVGGDYTSLASNIERALTAGNYLLNADGSISASNPAASTIYYAYLLGPGHTDPDELRYSAAAPNSNGYLGTIGNAAHCRHVGWVRTNASVQFADAMAVASLFNQPVTTLESTGGADVTNSTTGAWEDVIGFAVNVLLPVGWTVDVESSLFFAHSVEGSPVQFAVHEDGAWCGSGTDRHGTSVGITLVNVHSRRIYTSTLLAYKAYTTKTYAWANTATYLRGYSGLRVIRHPKDM